jgi:hypothetical protein
VRSASTVPRADATTRADEKKLSGTTRTSFAIRRRSLLATALDHLVQADNDRPLPAIHESYDLRAVGDGALREAAPLGRRGGLIQLVGTAS